MPYYSGLHARDRRQVLQVSRPLTAVQVKVQMKSRLLTPVPPVVSGKLSWVSHMQALFSCGAFLASPSIAEPITRCFLPHLPNRLSKVECALQQSCWHYHDMNHLLATRQNWPAEQTVLIHVDTSTCMLFLRLKRYCSWLVNVLSLLDIASS